MRVKAGKTTKYLSPSASEDSGSMERQRENVSVKMEPREMEEEFEKYWEKYEGGKKERNAYNRYRGHRRVGSSRRYEYEGGENGYYRNDEDVKGTYTVNASILFPPLE